MLLSALELLLASVPFGFGDYLCGFAAWARHVTPGNFWFQSFGASVGFRACGGFCNWEWRVTLTHFWFVGAGVYLCGFAAPVWLLGLAVLLPRALRLVALLPGVTFEVRKAAPCRW